ncbi:MAG: aspartate aminotransferase family protein [Deltaproteobacteria bacterium]|nr:aspartate aminotransferase family protein [Deltaproteobacteria bacterium]
MTNNQTTYNHRKPEGMWGSIFSSHTFEPILDRAEGIYLYDTDGNRYIDISGGPMAVGIGHGDKRVNEAIAKQLDKYAYCHPFLSDQSKAKLCAKLAEISPGDLNTAYLSAGGGSDAVESAIKIARQYHITTGKPEKNIVISNWESYHGVSLGALSVTGTPSMRKPFDNMLLKWPKILQYTHFGRPEEMDAEQWGVKMARNLAECIHYTGKQHISAYIATPWGCGPEYGLMAPAGYWKTIREICDYYDILLIADEVVSGFGRCGKWFCMEHFDVQADLMIMGKGITSLYAPLGGVMISDKVNEPFAKGSYFIHGFTNQGHPVACAASLAVIDILEKDGLVENSAKVGAYLHSQKDRLLKHTTVADARGRGLFMAIEIVADKETMDFFPRNAHAEFRLHSAGLENGVVFYSTLYGPRHPGGRKRGLPFWIAPPLCTSEAHVDELLDAVDKTLTIWEKQMGVTP